ncbi:uncharacterized protein TNCV_4988301 [Trichonephila clavipes]|nr:uncharacterized protein TNCV_4988301 [Trichonephila clavipes]
MQYDRALGQTSSVWCLETFRSIFAVTLPLVRSNLWDAQLAPSQIIIDMLDCRQIWGSGRLWEGFLLRGTTPNKGIDGWASRAAHVMGAVIPNVLQPGTFVWFEKTQGILMKVLHVPRWWPMKQLAVRVHFLRCGDLLDDWSIEGVLSLVFV